MNIEPSTIPRPNPPAGVSMRTATPAAPLPAGASALPDSAAIAGAAFVEPERRRAMIAEAAYYKAEKRSFEPGCELEDWCAAEGDIDAMLTRGDVPLACGI